MDALKLRREDLDWCWRVFRHVRGVSPLFGRLLGDVRLQRRGGWVAADGAVVMQLQRRLQPLDILLERSRFRLTDRMIPGFFNHAAVYLGRRAEVAAMLAEGRDDPGGGGPRERCLEQVPVDQGCVLEASRAGVRLVALARFIDVDELAVLRDGELDAPARAVITRRALAQLGKAYDYGFDLRDSERQFCSKLVAEVFAHRAFGGRGALPLPTLLPDHIAESALDAGSALEPVFFSPRAAEDSPARLRALLARQLAPAPAR